MRKKILLPLCAALCLAGVATASAGSTGSDLQAQYDELLEKYNTLQAEYDELLGKYNALIPDESESFELSTGTYVVGEDIQAGKYNVSVLSGYGRVEIWESLEEYRKNGNWIESYYVSSDDGDTISNMRLYDGECLTVDSQIKLRFGNDQAEDESRTEESASSDAITLSAGYYTVGKDIPEGKYNLKAVHGNGAVSVSNAVGDINTYLMAEEKSNLRKTLPGSYKVSLDEVQLTKGYSLIIADSLIVEFTVQ